MTLYFLKLFNPYCILPGILGFVVFSLTVLPGNEITHQILNYQITIISLICFLIASAIFGIVIDAVGEFLFEVLLISVILYPPANMILSIGINNQSRKLFSKIMYFRKSFKNLDNQNFELCKRNFKISQNLELDVNSMNAFLDWAKQLLTKNLKLRKKLEILKSEYKLIRNFSLVCLFLFSISVIFPIFSIVLIKRFCNRYYKYMYNFLSVTWSKSNT